MKILGGELEPTAGDVILGPGIEEWRHNQLMREVPPGLKLRVLLAQALFSRPDVLLLDEPTNHMDMESIESLQIGLEKYPGTLIFVSHDREFVGALANRVIELKPGGGVVDFKGSYDEYLEACGLPA
jgi:ATPase subunit of ABC transporter with duplicated ATPase domains